MSQAIAYLSSAYLAPIQYYHKLLSYPQVVIEQYDHYLKQTYRNRCNIIGAEGIQTLSIPIVKPSSPKSFMKDILISDHGNWKHLHWQAIRSAYSNTPYFEFYEEYFAPSYKENNIKFLLDFNEQLQQTVLDLINCHPNYTYSKEYKMEFKPYEYDYRELIHPKKDFRKVDTDFISKPYYQVFQQKHGFTPNLSIIDLLFHKGPAAVFYLYDSLLAE